MCFFLRKWKRSKVPEATEIVEESINEEVTAVKVEDMIKPGGHHEIMAVSESITIEEKVNTAPATKHKSSESSSANHANVIKEEEGDLFDIQPFK